MNEQCEGKGLNLTSRWTFNSTSSPNYFRLACAQTRLEINAISTRVRRYFDNWTNYWPLSKTGLSTQNDIDGSTINSDDCDKHFSKNVYEEIWIRLNRAAKGWNRPNPNLPLSLALWLSRLRFRKDPHHWNNKTKNSLTSTLAGATRRLRKNTKLL